MEIPVFESFPAKLLLFGEYLVIQGEEALAIPLQNFKGKLELSQKSEENNVAPFIQYLGALPNIYLNQDLIEHIALDRLIFHSNIPVGYGAGSSGALTAAVYDAFVLKHDGLLQEALASMEDFFHGSSSGLDPLISYRRKPSKAIDRKLLENFYLLDTGISRQTAPLVQIFKEKRSNLSFEALAQYNKSAIRAMESGNIQLLEESMRHISAFQWENFKEMIPEHFSSIWKEILDDTILNIKLCGAGGGGFLLLYASDRDYAQKWAAENKIDFIPILY